MLYLPQSYPALKNISDRSFDHQLRKSRTWFAAPAEVKKIAVFRALKIGDFLCSVPVLRLLRSAYPLAEITYIGTRVTKELVLRYHDCIDSFITFPGFPGLPEVPFDKKNWRRFLNQVKTQHFDLVLQMHGDGTIVNSIVSQFESRFLAGFGKKPESIDAKSYFIPYPNALPEREKYVLLLEKLGIENSTLNFEVPFTAYDDRRFGKLQKRWHLQEKAYVCLHPGASERKKQWPLLFFATLGNELQKVGYQIVITGSISEIALGEELASLLREKPIVASGKTTFGTLGLLFKNSVLVIGNDTGPLHLSYALGVPSLVIFAKDRLDLWAYPEGKSYQVVEMEDDLAISKASKKINLLLRGGVND